MAVFTNFAATLARQPSAASLALRSKKPITKLENSFGTLKSTYKVCCRVVPLSELIMLSIHNVLCRTLLHRHPKLLK